MQGLITSLMAFISEVLQHIGRSKNILFSSIFCLFHNNSIYLRHYYGWEYLYQGTLIYNIMNHNL